MSATRRNVLGAALTVPLLARLGGTAFAAAEDDRYGTISDAWVEVWWTPQVQAELDRLEAVVEAVAPARETKDSRGRVIRMPVRSGRGDPSLTNLPKAEGDGVLDGGVSVRTPIGTLLLTDLGSVLKDGLVSGRCVVNGVDVGHASALRCGLTEGRLITDTVPLGEPLKIRLNEVPLRPTAEALKVYTATFGTSPFTEDTVLGHVTAEGLYLPPKA